MLLQEGLSAQGLRVDCAATTEEALAFLGRSAMTCSLRLASLFRSFMVDGHEAARRILEAAGNEETGPHLHDRRTWLKVRKPRAKVSPFVSRTFPSLRRAVSLERSSIRCSGGNAPGPLIVF